jgi:hypothetical protein
VQTLKLEQKETKKIEREKKLEDTQNISIPIFT